MPAADRLGLVRNCYAAWTAADREAIERLLAHTFTFSSPPDPRLDRDGYFERCWPAAGTNAEHFEFTRLAEVGDEALVTYVATRPDGTRFQNTEIFGFDEDRIARIEVYFGWELAS
jgi:hypothetical protein